MRFGFFRSTFVMNRGLILGLGCRELAVQAGDGNPLYHPRQQASADRDGCLPSRPSGRAAAGGTKGIQGIVGRALRRISPAVKQFGPENLRGRTCRTAKSLVLELRREELAVQAGDGSPLFKGDSGDCQSCAAAHIARGKTVRPRKPSGPNLSYSKILVLELR